VLDQRQIHEKDDYSSLFIYFRIKVTHSIEQSPSETDSRPESQDIFNVLC
jgi:hypothetical protein